MDKRDPRQELEDWLASLPLGEPMTSEEIAMTTPYSDVQAWERMLEYQLLWMDNKSFLKGPPGLLEKVATRLSLITEAEATSKPLNSATEIPKIAADSGTAST